MGAETSSGKDRGRTGGVAPSPGGAVLWMLGAVLALTMMGVSGRELAGTLPLPEIVLFRNLFTLAIVLALAARYGSAILKTGRPLTHLCRNVIHFAAQVGWYYGLALLPLAEVFAIEFTTPIWVALMATLFLGERLTPIRFLAVLLGFGGVLLILRPASGSIEPAALVVLAAAVGYAAAFAFTKALTRTDGALTILFYMNLIQFPLALVPSLFDWVTPPPELWIWVLATGLAGFASHYCLSRAFALADASVVAPIDFVRLPLAAGIGWLVYAEAVDAWLGIGAVVIVLANYLNLRGQRRRA